MESEVAEKKTSIPRTFCFSDKLGHKTVSHKNLDFFVSFIAPNLKFGFFPYNLFYIITGCFFVAEMLVLLFEFEIFFWYCDIFQGIIPEPKSRWISVFFIFIIFFEQIWTKSFIQVVTCCDDDLAMSQKENQFFFIFHCESFRRICFANLVFKIKVCKDIRRTFLGRWPTRDCRK